MANAGIGLGAIIGGAVIEHWSLSDIGYVAAAIAMLAIVVSPGAGALKSKEAIV